MRGYSQAQWTMVVLALATAPLALINQASPLVVAVALVFVTWVTVSLLVASRTSPFSRSLNLLALSLLLLTAADVINIGRPHIPVEWDTNSIIHNALTTLAWILRLFSLILIRRALPFNRSSSRLDPWIVVGALALVGLAEVLYPILDSSVSIDIKISALLATVLRAIVLVEVLRIWLVSGVVISRALNWLIAGLLFSQIAEAWEVVAAIRQGLTIEVIDDAGIPTAISLFALACIGAASLDKSIHLQPIPAPSSGLDVTRARIFVLTIAVLVVSPLLVILDPSVIATSPRTAIYLVSTLTIIGLVSLRIFSVINAYRSSLEREQILADVTDALVRTTTVEEVQQNLPVWVVRLTGIRDLKVDARPVLWEDEPPTNTQVRLDDGTWHSELLVPGQDLMALDIYWDRPLSDDKLSLLRVFARSLGVTLDRISYSAQLTERQANQRIESLLANSGDVVMVVSQFGHISYSTPAVDRVLDRSATSLLGEKWLGLVAESDATRAERLLDEARKGANAQAELRFPTSRGLTRFLDCTLTWIDADDVFIITHHDVTERHHLQTQLIDQAFHDPLTGLANRALFRDRVGQALAHSRRTGGMFAVILLDIDDFKTVNDSLGHPAGDQLLTRFAERIQGCLRAGDTAARLGGDEFAVVLENTHSLDEAITVAQRIMDNIRKPIEVLGNQLNPSASMGIAMGSGDTSDSENLERDADLALYQAKYEGKDRYAVFEPEMHGEAMRRLQTITELRRAVDAGEIKPWFQPIVSLGSGAICGLEALARWEHPTHGLMEPKSFITLAEDTGIIVPLGKHMMVESLKHIVQWQKQFGDEHQRLRVSINLSVRQVFHESIVEDIAYALEHSDVDPATVVLEITESVFLPGERLAVTRVKDLSNLGVQIYIDDFGTGYSSLRYLRELPVNGIKMAREFVEHLPDPTELGFARAIRDLAGTLGLDDIIAEGIETDAQRVALHQLGYHLGQGYLLGRPLPADAVTDLLSRTPSEQWSLRYFPGPAVPSSMS